MPQWIVAQSRCKAGKGLLGIALLCRKHVICCRGCNLGIDLPGYQTPGDIDFSTFHPFATAVSTMIHWVLRINIVSFNVALRFSTLMFTRKRELISSFLRQILNCTSTNNGQKDARCFVKPTVSCTMYFFPKI